MFLLLPFALYFLDLSVKNAGTYARVQECLSQVSYKLLLWMFLAALTYHLLAGIRHMIMDLGFGESLECGRRSALWVIILAVIFTLLLGIWIW